MNRKRIAQVLAVVLAFGMLFGVMGNAALALTQAEVDVVCALFGCDDDQRAALDALVSGGSGGSCPALVQPLTEGSTGQSVTDLQNYLMGAGFDIPAISSGVAAPGFFGTQTQSAVAAWQSANGVSPAAGYWGPISLSMYNSVCVPGDDVDDEDMDEDDEELQGGAGSIDDVDYISKINNEKVGEDESDVDVAGLEIEADDGSDIALVAVNLNFSQGTANRDFDKYAEDVSVWLDGVELARIDADEFEDDDNFDKNVTLASGGVIRAGDTGDLVVAVSGISNLDSGDENETWTLEFESVRFRDASGAVIADSTTGDINDGAGRTFQFENFATASDLELKITSGEDNINDARAIDVDDTNDTDNVELFSFNLEAEGNSDITIDDMPLTYTSVGADIDVIINTAELWIDGELVDSLSIPTTATTTSTLVFDNFDYTIEAGDTVEAVVRVDINDLEGTFTDGDTLSIQIGEAETNSADFDAEDEEGNDLADADKTGSATGDAHAFFDVGIQVSLVSATATAANNDTAVDDDVGTFTMVLDVTAFGATVFVGDTAAGTTVADAAMGVGATTDAIVYRVYDSGTATTDDLADLVTFTTPSGVTDSTDNIQIEQDRTSRVTLTVTQTNDSAEDDGIYFMDLGAVYWGIADDTAYEFRYNFNLDEFETNTIQLN